jgi:hypothetical protein
MPLQHKTIGARTHYTRRFSVLISVVSLLAASAVAAVAWFHTVDLSLSCSGNPARGANLQHALAIVFLGGIIAAILIALLWRRGTALVAAVLLGAALLGTGLIFVAFDSATYIQLDRRCTDFGFGPLPKATAHFGYLYVVWGALAAVLLIYAALLLVVRRLNVRGNAERPPPAGAIPGSRMRDDDPSRSFPG